MGISFCAADSIARENWFVGPFPESEALSGKGPRPKADQLAWSITRHSPIGRGENKDGRDMKVPGQAGRRGPRHVAPMLPWSLERQPEFAHIGSSRKDMWKPSDLADPVSVGGLSLAA